MFQKILSSVGIGSAKVNTILLDELVERGKEIKGEVHIFGGKTEQKISKIYIHIDSEFHKSHDDDTDFRDVTEPILEIEITDSLTVNPGEEKVIPFSFILPYYTPTTFRNQKVTIETEIDINFINHPIEYHDFVVCDKWLNEILGYLHECGFSHNGNSGVCRHKKSAADNPTHCLQTFTLVNSKGMKINFVGNQKDLDLFIFKNEIVQHYPLYRDKDLKEQLHNLHSSMLLKG